MSQSHYPPLQFAQDITSRSNEAWLNGEFLENVTSITRDLLTYWFADAHTEIRELNFHEGQKQAILNTIYLHEVLQAKNIFSAYEQISPDLLSDKKTNLQSLSEEKYSHPKYCIKMATGTGKTWGLSALLIWQYLNAKHEKGGNFSKNFLIVAPGLIVYERLLDAFIGKEREDGGGRDFEKSDIYKMQETFIPDQYRQEVFGFFQSSVVAKEEIGRKTTGEGLIAVTNWRLIAGVESDTSKGFVDDTSIEPDKILKQIPRPGKASGNDLDVLDSPSGGEVLEFLHSLPDLVVFNDEAHHIHEVKKKGEAFEVEWQKSLSYIAKTKSEKFIQIDFSATPYNQKGRDKVFFPHIIVDFDLKTAIQKGFVKTLVLDERKEIASMELDFKAERDENGNITGLSEGQRVMLRAGLKKLDILEECFEEIILQKTNKYPKMLIVCEDTSVVSHVSEFLKGEGVGNEDVMEIHSNKKGEVGQNEWNEIKNKLFHLDNHASPRIVISVLMLREGFDVNNICVIVPLRSSQSGILLEQTIGRGLRLMWREPEFQEEKAENRYRLLIEKTTPKNYFDILSIVEHPAFRGFYDELIQEGLVGVDAQDIDNEKVIGDIINVGLRENYKKYDFSFPIVLREPEEVLKKIDFSPQDLHPLEWPTLDQLRKMVGKGEQFISEEATKGTRFGDYAIESGLMSATSYNDYISRLLNRVSTMLSDPISRKAHSKSRIKYPAIQINFPEIAGVLDGFIRKYLFDQEFNPFENENWKVLMTDHVSKHIINELASFVMKMQETETVSNSEVILRKTSEIDVIRMREEYAIDVAKSIYEKVSYPSNRGGFEKDFIEFSDRCASVQSFIKLLPHAHNFVRLRYIKEDGLSAYYHPDFLVRTENENIYMVETKGDDQIIHPNVKRKQASSLHWIEKVNNLPLEKRDGAQWSYVLVGQDFFNDWVRKGASMQEILEFAKLRESNNGKLF